MILIGSLALQAHVAHLVRPTVDVDLVGNYDEIMAYRKNIDAKVCYPINQGKSIYMRRIGGAIVEAEVAWPDSMAERLIKFVESQSDNIVMANGTIVPSLDVLYLLKMSHRYKKDSPHFKKTLEDIMFMRKLGAKIRPEHEEFFKQRERETYTNSLPRLNVSRADFFNSNVTGVVQVYVHDQVHEAVKHLERPAYEYFKPDTAEVMCSKEMFEKCPDEVKLYSVVEEAMVLAIERSLSVFPGKKTPREAFEMALMKCCTSIASGWWREFAWENYYNVMNLFHEDFYDKFMEKVKQGLVEYKDKQ
jgi:hypothetical protein